MGSIGWGNPAQLELPFGPNLSSNMRTEITRRFAFEAAHHLPLHRGKCRTPHGHSYKLYVTVGAQHSSANPRGFFLDFGMLKNIVEKYIIERLDHTDLNPFFQGKLNVVPSAENIAAWIWETLRSVLPTTDPDDATTAIFLVQVRLYETENCYVDVRG